MTLNDVDVLSEGADLDAEFPKDSIYIASLTLTNLAHYEEANAGERLGE